MKIRNCLRLALAAGLTMGALPQAFAATAAGVTITNTASVAYKVATIDQTPVDSNAAEFIVDRIIDIDVTADNSPLSVDPGETDRLAFTVTNQSNATIDIGLAVTQTATNTVLDSPTDLDSLTMENFSFFIDLNGDGILDVGEAISVIPSLAAGDSMVVYAVAKTPDTAANALLAGVSLLATAREAAGGAVITETAGADTVMTMDTVFDDGDGPVTGDADEDGKMSAYGYFEVASADLTVFKSSRVVSDPVNNTTNPKAIPGAVIEYCIVVRNDGTSDADEVVVNDSIPAETTYVEDSLFGGVTGTDTTCDTPLLANALSDDTDADDGEFVAGVLPAKGDVTVRGGSVAEPDGRYRVVFRVTVD
ncbi:MAG: hypothetical protein K0Q68_1148 [Moraxellaceae bacterium]|jgi:uncharacterized repeat protein (TIGR01451 family)|nr:hypothetical protein [Moraxellaceae bacterium]